MFLKSIFLLFGLIIGYRILRIFVNYISARKLGLPIIIVPATWQDTIWVLTAPLFRFLKDVPGFGWCRYSYLGCNLRLRHNTHAQLKTQAFVIVSPGQTEIVVVDEPACAEWGGKYNKWDKPLDLYSLGRVWAKCLVDKWRGLAKISTDRQSRTCNKRPRESECCKAAREWLATISNGQTKTLKELGKDMNIISSNVLNYAGFEQDNDFVEGTNKLKEIPEGHRQNFAQAMYFMRVEFLFAWIFSNVNLPQWCQFPKFKELKLASAELRQYFSEIVTRRDGEVVRALVEANEKEKAVGGSHLNAEELFGNMYLVQLAGYETTSSAMLFALGVLPAYPDVQEWARGSDERCTAVMYEILRFYGSVPVLTRYSEKVESITIVGKELVVPAKAFVTGRPQAYHHYLAVWGPDVGQWKPSRWIELVDGQEKIKKQPELLAWSAGVRVCPGMKFSQIEFATVIKAVLEEYEMRGNDGILKTVGEYDSMVSPKMRKPEESKVTFVRRTSSR